ncbi:hypothetical protein HYFRA_00013966 [Hymenoscyphus fraxineus]|uniref:glucan endo-1,6-beta-glucosidase n=1 Tax=Hymenoscyphus fraxineus TaxID=746836 RepID=A0A9N9LBI8_9HELO|nr:hypothetical protein HYFRA_00013966 [Hymenoscyphus fraxineus]
MLFSTYLPLFLALQVQAWMPGDIPITSSNGTNLFKSTSRGPNYLGVNHFSIDPKIRGVNLGSLFVFEPWMVSKTWASMGCGNYSTEFDCVVGLGQDAANKAFQGHWSTWITQKDIEEIVSVGLNTIRIPLGYWLVESLVWDNEFFPQGAFPYLERIVGWASDAGLYVVLDLHAAPGAQVTMNAFTGQNAIKANFYNTTNYDRAVVWLEWMTKVTHTNRNFRNVGMVQIINEPISWASNTTVGLVDYYYPKAYDAIRKVEKRLRVPKWRNLHIQAMNSLWGSGNFTQNITDPYYVAWDDHRYTKYDTSVAKSHEAYIKDGCTNSRERGVGETPTVVGEWSLSVPTDVEWDEYWNPYFNHSMNVEFYNKWFAAQLHSYEKTNGWIFWTWKNELGDYRWSYQESVIRGVIPVPPQDYDKSVCDGVQRPNRTTPRLNSTRVPVYPGHPPTLV